MIITTLVSFEKAGEAWQVTDGGKVIGYVDAAGTLLFVEPPIGEGCRVVRVGHSDPRAKDPEIDRAELAVSADAAVALGDVFARDEAETAEIKAKLAAFDATPITDAPEAVKAFARVATAYDWTRDGDRRVSKTRGRRSDD
jgi:hypothetical protein